MSRVLATSVMQFKRLNLAKGVVYLKNRQPKNNYNFFWYKHIKQTIIKSSFHICECLGKNAIAYWQDTILLCFCIKKIPPSFGFKVRNSLLCACSDFKVCEVLLKLIPPSLPKQMVQWSLVLVPILLVLFPPSLCHQRKKRVMTRSDVSQSPISDLFYASPY